MIDTNHEIDEAASKYTPRPWQDNGNGLIYGQVTGDEDEAPFVADVCRDGAAGFYSNQEQANARLITAAPRLLEALERIFEILPQGKHPWEANSKEVLAR